MGIEFSIINSGAGARIASLLEIVKQSSIIKNSPSVAKANNSF